MLTGKRPFEGATQASTIGAILHAAPAPVSTWQPSVSPALDRVIATCLAKDPDERWQSVGDLKRELQWSAEAGASSFAPDTLGPPRRTRGALAWGLAIVASVLAAVAWSLYLRQARATDAIVRFQIPAPPGAVRATQAAFAVAPDGRSLAFVARSADGMPRVFIRQLDMLATHSRWPVPTARRQAVLGARRPIARVCTRRRTLSRRSRWERPTKALRRAWQHVWWGDVEPARRDRLRLGGWPAPCGRHRWPCDTGDDAATDPNAARSHGAVVSSGWPAPALPGAWPRDRREARSG